MNSTNPMQEPYIEKVTLNIGAGKNEEQLKKGLILLKKLVSIKPVKTQTKRRVPGWGLRPGLSIGAKATVRKDAELLVKRLLTARRMKLLAKNFDSTGNVSFGVPEYIDIEGLEYDPDLKIIGLEAAVTLVRPGYRVKRRTQRPGKIGKTHLVSREDAMAYFKKLGVEIEA
tara:strand:+ start:528 stop:1040 length:513 start_codon:yes stop_codon:yes gene_type:complete